jgi:hypothetical protein
MEELEKAHQDYEERKTRLLANLETLASNLRCDPTIPKNYVEWIEIAIEFIKEKEI